MVEATLALMREGMWHVGVGIGRVEEPTPEDLREARGPAFLAARQAVDEAKDRSDHLRVVAAPPAQDEAQEAEVLLSLVLSLRTRRSPAGWAACRSVRPGPDPGRDRRSARHQPSGRAPATGGRAVVARRRRPAGGGTTARPGRRRGRRAAPGERSMSVAAAVTLGLWLGASALAAWLWLPARTRTVAGGPGEPPRSRRRARRAGAAGRGQRDPGLDRRTPGRTLALGRRRSRRRRRRARRRGGDHLRPGPGQRGRADHRAGAAGCAARRGLDRRPRATGAAGHAARGMAGGPGGDHRGEGSGPLSGAADPLRCRHRRRRALHHRDLREPGVGGRVRLGADLPDLTPAPAPATPHFASGTDSACEILPGVESRRIAGGPLAVTARDSCLAVDSFAPHEGHGHDRSSPATDASRRGDRRATRPSSRRRGAPRRDRGGWTLMLVPATICLAMFVVAFWW